MRSLPLVQSVFQMCLGTFGWTARERSDGTTVSPYLQQYIPTVHTTMGSENGGGACEFKEETLGRRCGGF